MNDPRPPKTVPAGPAEKTDKAEKKAPEKKMGPAVLREGAWIQPYLARIERLAGEAPRFQRKRKRG